MTLSFKTEQYCPDLKVTIPVYAIGQKRTLGTHLANQVSFQFSNNFSTAIKQAQRLPSDSSELWYCIPGMPRAPSAAKLLQYWFFMLYVIQFQYNRLRYEPALTAAIFSLLPFLRENNFYKTRREHQHLQSLYQISLLWYSSGRAAINDYTLPNSNTRCE